MAVGIGTVTDILPASFYSPWSGSATVDADAADNQLADPQYVSETGGSEDLHVQVGSPAVGAAVAITVPDSVSNPNAICGAYPETG